MGALSVRGFVYGAVGFTTSWDPLNARIRCPALRICTDPSRIREQVRLWYLTNQISVLNVFFIGHETHKIYYFVNSVHFVLIAFTCTYDIAAMTKKVFCQVQFSICTNKIIGFEKTCLSK